MKEYLPGQQNIGIDFSQWGSVCGRIRWSPIRVEISLFFAPGDPGRVERSDRDLDALHAVGANVLKPYVGDVEGKDVRNSTAPTAEHVAWTLGERGCTRVMPGGCTDVFDVFGG